PAKIHSAVCNGESDPSIYSRDQGGRVPDDPFHTERAKENGDLKAIKPKAGRKEEMKWFRCGGLPTACPVLPALEISFAKCILGKLPAVAAMLSIYWALATLRNPC
ncbi:hypothetical protein QQF64_022300, partial [Cirrhinus molitorella]